MKYAAVVKHAQEVTLIGTANADTWLAPLALVGLTPFKRDGRAQLMISVASGKWGIQFREVAVAVAACRSPGCQQPDGYYSAYAFHSSRWFAWCERTFFKASHRVATIDIRDDVPALIEVRHGMHLAMHASMGTEREASQLEDVDMVLPVFLPDRGARDKGRRNLFHVWIAGETRIYPFIPEADVFSAGDDGGHLATPLLSECDFAGHEWHIRSDVTHGRTKTISEAIGVA